jgi:hypothetical protein
MIHLFNNFLPTSLTVTVRCHGNCWREEMTSPRFFCHLPSFISLSPSCRLLYQQINLRMPMFLRPRCASLISAYFVMVKERLWIHDIKITFFSDMAPCNLADRYQCLGIKYTLRTSWCNGNTVTLYSWRCVVRILVRAPYSVLVYDIFFPRFLQYFNESNLAPVIEFSSF